MDEVPEAMQSRVAQDFDPHHDGIEDWDHKEFNVSNRHYRPSVVEALDAIQATSIDLEVGWSEELQIAVVHSCIIGNANSSHPILRLDLSPRERSAVISHLDFGTLPFGRVETEESRRLIQRKERAESHWRIIDEIGEQNFVDVVEGQVPSSRLTTEQWHQEIARAAPPRLITTQKLLLGLVKPEYRKEDGTLEPMVLRGCSSPIPATTQFFTMDRICYPRGPVMYDEWCQYDHACESIADRSSDSPPSQKPKKPAHDPRKSDWRNPEQVTRDFLEPLYNAISVGFINCCRAFLTNSLYLSSVRVHPPRDFHPVEPMDSRRWPNGLAAWDLLISKEAEILEPLNEWLNGDPNRFRSGFQVEVQRIKQVDTHNPEIAKLLAGNKDFALDDVRSYLANLPEERLLRIRKGPAGVLGQPRDVGYGLSQLLPVIVAALHTKSGIVAVEEPESNIHPAFQVVLADLFITQAKANPNALFLIETHSEHLMLRCLRRIRESSKGLLPEGLPSVSPEDVAVHFVELANDGPRIERKEIDEDGDFIDEWPDGFFEESARERFAGR